MPAVRKVSAFVDQDRALSEDFARVNALIASGALAAVLAG